jgi:hypothetical protein
VTRKRPAWSHDTLQDAKGDVIAQFVLGSKGKVKKQTGETGDYPITVTSIG